MSVLRRAKLRTPDGIESIEYPLGVEAENVEVANQENLSQRLVRIDEDLKKNEEDIAAVSELAGINKQNIGANEIRIDALERRSSSVVKKPYYFDTVADMKAYQGLIEGDMAITLGYYEVNDGGGAEYKIIRNTDNYKETLNNQLFAELIIKNKMNIKQFGAKSINNFDNFNIIDNAISSCSNLYIPIGNYFISKGLIINNPINIKGKGCIYITNGLNITPITIDSNNVSIDGIEIDGKAPFVQPGDYSSNEYKQARSSNLFGLYVLNSQNVNIKNCKIHNITQGIVVRNSNYININNNIVYDTLADGIYVSDASHFIYVTKNTINNSGDDALACVSTRVTYNLTDLQAISGFNTSLTYQQLQDLISSTGASITPIKSFNSSCSDIYFIENTVNTSWNSGLKIHGGNKIIHANNIINKCYSWGLNYFFADRCQISQELAYYTFSNSVINTFNNIFNDLLNNDYKQNDLGTANIEGCQFTNIDNNTFNMSNDSSYTNPLTRIASGYNVIFSNNKMNKTKLFIENSNIIKVDNNNILNSYTFGISANNTSNIDIENNNIYGFNTSDTSWIYGISLVGSSLHYNANINGNKVVTSHKYQGENQIQYMSQVYIDKFDLYRRDPNTDISLLGRVNHSANIKTTKLHSIINPSDTFTQFANGTVWFNETTNIFYFYNGVNWIALN